MKPPDINKKLVLNNNDIQDEDLLSSNIDTELKTVKIPKKIENAFYEKKLWYFRNWTFFVAITSTIFFISRVMTEP
jgi:hypothetical protein